MTMDKLKQLQSFCKSSISLEYRARSRVYETLSEAAVTQDKYYGPDTFLSEEDMKKCFETDEYWTLHFYPDTPVGFYHAHSNDVEALLDWGLAIMEDLRK